MRGNRLMRRVGMRSRLRLRNHEPEAAWGKPCSRDEPDGPQRHDERRAAKRQPNELETPFPRRRLPLVSAWPPGSCPGGTPEEISRGQVRARGRRPRKPCRVASCPSGASKKWPGMRADHWWSDRPEATRGGGDAAGRATPTTSPMPRWGRTGSAWQPGAAPADAGLPPANFLRCPSGTKRQAAATILRWSAGCQRNGKIRASRPLTMSENDKVANAPSHPSYAPNDRDGRAPA